ncbi:cytochrome P450 2K1-like [Nelusetta ayraudi]|uniref:cytochrome P450 2K1-like n=1 Tax=Nelusetta ayraudi TaxID=303726 RepID=UPI003F71A226
MGLCDFVLSSPTSVCLLAVLLLLSLLYLAASHRLTDHRKGPPGPRPLPVLGNLLQVDIKRPYYSLLELSKKYGSVFTVYLGSQKVVVLAGYRTVKEALVTYSKEFGDRYPPLALYETTKDQGLTWANGDSWREMRRFALTNLRDFGMGKKSCEEKIIEECDHLVEVFKRFKGEPFDTTKPVNRAVSNIICSLVYGYRFEYGDPEFTSLVDRTNKFLEVGGSPSIQIFNLFPWVRALTANKRVFDKLFFDNKTLNLHLFDRLKETLNPQLPRGFVDAFMVREQNVEESGTKSNFHTENLALTAIDLITAGTDTTATTIRWGLLLMSKYPEIQDQVQEEISSVIGARQVQMEDRRNLPFTDAVIHETLRLACILPMALPHRTSQDVTFQGHFIPKGTTVFPLLMSVLYDENEWEEPRRFHPAHFLDKDGKFVKRDAFMPFSAGRRVCMGEGLAKMELFIFFTTLLQHFRFSPPAGVSADDLDLTPRVGLTLNPSAHRLCATACM